MPNTRQPRSGSMQFWPRKRAKRAYARTRTFPESDGTGMTGFAGYKVGMTHIQAIETRKGSHRKGEEVSIPVSIVECPPMKMYSARLYKKSGTGIVVSKEIVLSNDKELSKKTSLPKKEAGKELDNLNPEEYEDIRVLVYTQPKLTQVGKKKPELFEIGLAGTVSDKINYVKDNRGKEIFLSSVFNEGDFLDIKAVTKGKGFQGPVKRFGISIRQAKSEKAIRNPGSLGPWCGQGHIMWRVAHAGKMGFHQRTEYNKQIIKIVEDPKEITPEGGFLKYGSVKNPALLIRGSLPGARKRMVIMQKPLRLKKTSELPTLLKISKESKQGN
ncbi:50S ribosomal protein L3 [Candidatus Woesearchaeota archaeon]|nr:50S ribosomal protein L3 [Candidatus Woesearchaeota archaeon]